MKNGGEKINNDNNASTNATHTEELLHFENEQVTVIDSEVKPKQVKKVVNTTKKSNEETGENEEKPIKLTRQEKRKLRIINRLIAGEINGPKAAKLLKVTTRQVRNLKRQVLEEGESGIIHKNRFYKPVNTYDLDLRKQIASTYRKEFKGTNFTEFARIMQERGYDLSRSTIYNILRENRIRSPQRKKKKRKKVTANTTENSEI